jgi:hypothetical protein
MAVSLSLPMTECKQIPRLEMGIALGWSVSPLASMFHKQAERYQ